MRRVDYQESFRQLLRDCLRANPRDQILVIYDESLFTYFDDLLQVMIEDRLSVSFFHLPRKYQLALIQWREPSDDDSPDVYLPNALNNAINDSSLILTLLAGDMDTFNVRRSIVNKPRSKQCRLAHVPGVSGEVLQVLSKSPIAQIMRESEQVAWALGEARHAELTTYDLNGGSHVLKLDLGGWDHEPLMSPGMIFPGSWGNIPPGESFWCPSSPSVGGEICINGSVPRAPLREGQEVVLYFESGRLARWETAGDGPAGIFLATEAASARVRGDQQWDLFAELGIGLNPAIEELTGNPLFDEKMAGTVHVALGDNSVFGFPIRADRHLDLVTCHPTLKLDNREIIISGRLQTEVLDQWRRGLELPPAAVDGADELVLHAEKFEFLNDKAMRRLSRADRLGYVEMADGVPALRLKAVVDILLEGFRTTLLELHGKLHLRDSSTSPADFDRALATLLHYCVVEIHPLARSPG
jgi:hypothetical protein